MTQEDSTFKWGLSRWSLPWSLAILSGCSEVMERDSVKKLQGMFTMCGMFKTVDTVAVKCICGTILYLLWQHIQLWQEKWRQGNQHSVAPWVCSQTGVHGPLESLFGGSKNQSVLHFKTEMHLFCYFMLCVGLTAQKRQNSLSCMSMWMMLMELNIFCTRIK